MKYYFEENNNVIWNITCSKNVSGDSITVSMYLDELERALENTNTDIVSYMAVSEIYCMGMGGSDPNIFRELYVRYRKIVNVNVDDTVDIDRKNLNIKGVKINKFLNFINHNTLFDGRDYIVGFGCMKTSKKGNEYLKINFIDSENATHVLVKVDWGGSFDRSRGLLIFKNIEPSIEKKVLKISNGGGLGTTYYLINLNVFCNIIDNIDVDDVINMMV